MNLLFLLIGTIISISFIIFLFKGQKYDAYIEALSGDAFPLKDIYSVGFILQEIPLMKLQGNLGNKIRRDTTLYYSVQFGEFYAISVWAQTLSIGYLFLAITFLIAGMCSDMTMTVFSLVAGLFLCFFTGYYFLSYTSDKVKKRREACDIEFPNAISKLALLVNSGMILSEAWNMVAYGKEGVFYSLMRKSCEEIINGKSEIDAIYEFGVLTDSQDIKKFTTALIQSIEKGGGELSFFLANQSSELWNHKKQLLLQKGEKAAGALLAPIGIMFAGIMLIVIAAAVQSFSV